MSDKLVGKSQEVIVNLRKSGLSEPAVYAYAFGMAWAWLSDESRERIMNSAEVMAEQKEGK